jgi:creatinine amidohydrolase
MSLFWADLPTTAFTPDTMRDRIAVLPLAAIEQHGPHLPVGVDTILAQGFVAAAAAALPADSPALFLPVVPVCKSNEHIRFPGTLTLNWDTAARSWIEIGESVARAGIKRLLIVTSHGGNVAPMDIVARELRQRLNLQTVTTGWARLRDARGIYDPEDQPFDIHGGESETSLMLHFRPDLVDMSRAEAFSSAQRALAGNSFLGLHGARANSAWIANDLHPKGPVGKASAATPEKGAEDARRIIAGFCTLIDEIAASPLPVA